MSANLQTLINIGAAVDVVVQQEVSFIAQLDFPNAPSQLWFLAVAAVVT